MINGLTQGVWWRFQFVIFWLFCVVSFALFCRRCVFCTSCSVSLYYPYSTSPSVLSNAYFLIKVVGMNNRDNNLWRPLECWVSAKLRLLFFWIYKYCFHRARSVPVSINHDIHCGIRSGFCDVLWHAHREGSSVCLDLETVTIPPENNSVLTSF